MYAQNTLPHSLSRCSYESSFYRKWSLTADLAYSSGCHQPPSLLCILLFLSLSYNHCCTIVFAQCSSELKLDHIGNVHVMQLRSLIANSTLPLQHSIADTMSLYIGIVHYPARSNNTLEEQVHKPYQCTTRPLPAYKVNCPNLGQTSITTFTNLQGGRQTNTNGFQTTLRGIVFSQPTLLAE